MELEELKATCEKQAAEIATLTEQIETITATSNAALEVLSRQRNDALNYSAQIETELIVLRRRQSPPPAVQVSTENPKG